MILAVTIWPNSFALTVIRYSQTGGHLRLTSNLRGLEPHVTIPAHKALKLGTLTSILLEVSTYLKIDREKLHREIFGK